MAETTEIVWNRHQTHILGRDSACGQLLALVLQRSQLATQRCLLLDIFVQLRAQLPTHNAEHEVEK